jgi:hypothetical protein
MREHVEHLTNQLQRKDCRSSIKTAAIMTIRNEEIQVLVNSENENTYEADNITFMN